LPDISLVSSTRVSLPHIPVFTKRPNDFQILHTLQYYIDVSDEVGGRAERALRERGWWWWCAVCGPVMWLGVMYGSAARNGTWTVVGWRMFR